MKCSGNRSEKYLAVLTLLCVPSLAGCTGSDSTAVGELARTEQPLRAGDSNIVPVREVPEDYRPLSAAGEAMEFAETTYSDGKPTHYADGSPVYLPDGQPVDYRPRNIQHTLHTMTRLFIRDVGQPRLGFEGSESSPQMEYLSLTPEATVEMQGDPNFVWLDPASGDICWRAYTCGHPECVARSAEPLIFATSVPGYTGGLEESQSLESALAPTRCPRCGRRDNIQEYDPPDTKQREQQLKSELEQVRGEL